MNVKVAIELYYIYIKYENLNTGNFSLTLSIKAHVVISPVIEYLLGCLYVDNIRF